jgi:heptaprenyl diphosphate synthase
MLFKDSTKFISPLLLISGFVTGFLLGLVAAGFMQCCTWFCSETFPVQSGALENKSNTKKTLPVANSILMLFLFFSVLSFFIFQKDYRLSIIMCTVFFLLNVFQCRILKKRIPGFLVSLLVIASVVFFSLLSPYGKVLFRLGKFSVTYGALTSGLKRGFTVCGTVYLSKILFNFDWVPSGKISLFVSEIFSYFSLLTDLKKTIHLKSFFSDLDSVLLSFGSNATENL